MTEVVLQLQTLTTLMTKLWLQNQRPEPEFSGPCSYIT